jgi:hypothetical protein
VTDIISTKKTAAVFVGSVLVSIDLVDVPLSNTTRGRAACTIDTAQSCSYCGNRIGIPECPEWTEAEGKPIHKMIPFYQELR